MQATREAADQRKKEQAVKVAEMLANPFGTQLEDTEGSLWAGPLYNLDFMFHMQLLNSSLRTTNQSAADVVFVPFYIQKLVKIDKELEKPNRWGSLQALTDEGDSGREGHQQDRDIECVKAFGLGLGSEAVASLIIKLQRCLCRLIPKQNLPE